MSRRYPLIIVASAVIAAALLCGCDNTAEGNAADQVSATATCPQSTQPGDPVCSAASPDCAGCPAMEGTEVVEADTKAETPTCPYATEGQECPEGCSCEKVEAADGTIVCAHDADCPALLDGSCPAAHEESCPAAQSGSCPRAAKPAETAGATSAETPTTTCPKACDALGTCPSSGEAS